MFDLRPLLDESRVGIERNLARMYSGGRFVLGPQTQALEGELALAFGAAGAVGVASGTSALELCLRAAGLTSPSQTVLVPSMTSLFTAQAVLAAGASLAVCDVDPATLLLTAGTVGRAWTPSVRAVIAVHLYGQPCQLAPLARLCRERNAVLIQDCCQAHGARIDGDPLTRFSPYCAYSFYPTKNLGALGDGGAILSSDPEILERLRLLRDGGRLGDQVARMPAPNARLDEIQSCYLRAFLPSLPRWNAKRRQLAGIYRQELASVPGLSLIPFDDDSVHHLLVVRTAQRGRLRALLDQHGIQTGIHYPVPIHLQPAFAPLLGNPASAPAAEQAAAEIVSLPLGPHLSAADVLEVCHLIRENAPG